MDLNLTAEETQFRDEFRAWLAKHAPKDWEHRRDETVEHHFAFLKTWQRTLYDGGWAGISWPREYGGRGASLMQQVIFWQEMALAGAPPMANVLGLGLVGPTLIAFGTGAQKSRYLRKILSAEEIWCQGFSEPNAGSDLAGLQTEARLDGGHYIVNGQKVWTSYGWASDWCELVVRTDPTAPKHKGLTVLLVDMKSPGIEVRPLRQMTGESEFGEVFFEDARVPRENLVGTIGEGWRIAMTVLAYERGASSLAYSQRFARDLRLLARALEERGRLTGSAREKVARLLVDNEVMRANGIRMLATFAEGKAPGTESSLEKIFWSEFDQRFRETAIDLLGPGGQLLRSSPGARPDVDWAREFLWSRAGTIYSGSSEVQRNIIAKRVLGLPQT
jgi:alkylation response protein AidB-like acyl-CoA dehydrogenase